MVIKLFLCFKLSGNLPLTYILIERLIKIMSLFNMNKKRENNGTWIGLGHSHSRRQNGRREVDNFGRKLKANW
jgi:hypothetical protein